MKGHARGVEVATHGPWPGWCCSYCAAPLELRGHGLYCASEGRWFATHAGIHRLLPDDRRREILPFLELSQRARRDEGADLIPARRGAEPQASLLDQAIAAARPHLGDEPWDVLQVGAGRCWAAARLLEEGHRVAAVDVDLDPEAGLGAAERFLPGALVLPRAEAEMEALPLEPAAFDLVLAVGALHTAPRLSRTLIELRRVTRRGGCLLAIETPVYQRRSDGEARVAERMGARSRRYGVAVPRESQEGYLVIGEISDLFQSAGWSLEVRGWPSRLAEAGRTLGELARGRRRGAWYPILLGRRDG